MCLTIEFFEQYSHNIFKADWRERERRITTVRKNVGENKYRTNEDGNKVIEVKTARDEERRKATKYIAFSERKVLIFAWEFAGYIVYWRWISFT